MSDSICNFLPVKHDSGSIKTIRFVYETEYTKLQQPFLCPMFLIYIVCSGTASLTVENSSYPLSRGTVFFAFPGCPFRLTGSEDFTYIYISFMGSGAPGLLSQFSITPQNPVFPGMEHLCPLYEMSIRRMDQQNANVLTEGLLLYTLSFLAPPAVQAQPLSAADNIFATIVDYVDQHYSDPEISLSRIAGIFSYSEKYLSSLFKRHMNIGFNAYLRNLRIQRAQELIEKQGGTLTDIARACGYRDASYFSKVFKSRTGWTPTEYIRIAEEKNSILKYLQ